MRKVNYLAGVHKDIQKFSDKAKQRIAQLLGMIIDGLELPPRTFKYMPSVGVGVYELRVKADKEYRVFYVAKFEEAIYVLHAFVKKTAQTPKKDVEKGRERYQVLQRCRQKE